MATSKAQIEEKLRARKRKPNRQGTSISTVFPTETYNELNTIAKKSHTTKTHVLRTAFELLKTALEAKKEGNRIVIANKKGEVIRDLQGIATTRTTIKKKDFRLF